MSRRRQKVIKKDGKRKRGNILNEGKEVKINALKGK